MQEKPSKACFRTTRGLDAADAVHSCFSSEGVFRGAHKLYHKRLNCSSKKLSYKNFDVEFCRKKEKEEIYNMKINLYFFQNYKKI